jgi:hypothetical protein
MIMEICFINNINNILVKAISIIKIYLSIDNYLNKKLLQFFLYIFIALVLKINKTLYKNVF